MGLFSTKPNKEFSQAVKVMAPDAAEAERKAKALETIAKNLNVNTLEQMAKFSGNPAKVAMALPYLK